jgi:hypothetical protein
MILVLDRGSVGISQASCYNQFNPSAVVHLHGQPPADIQGDRPSGRLVAGRLMAERGGGPEPARPPPESAYESFTITSCNAFYFMAQPIYTVTEYRLLLCDTVLLNKHAFFMFSFL